MEITPVFECFAPGIPRPQGSKTYLGNGRMKESSDYVRAWRQTVMGAALSVMLDVSEHERLRATLQGPVLLGAEFLFPRPRKHMAACSTCRRLRIKRIRGVCEQVHDADGLVVWDLAPTYVTCTPDLDKLIRAVQDSLKTAGVYKDDSQVVGYAGFPLTCKRYTNPGEEPGARIRVWKLA
jgi:Holliday junction resolvase RusA-like endonuclease